jgi:hypothetical protein
VSSQWTSGGDALACQNCTVSKRNDASGGAETRKMLIVLSIPNVPDNFDLILHDRRETHAQGCETWATAWRIEEN